MKLRNNTILITGGTSGIGYEFAAQLLALGNTVLITGRNQDKLDQTKQRLPGVHIFQSDVSDPAAIQALFEQVTAQFPALNLLLNNAGEMHKLNLQDPTLNVFDVTREIDIDMSGPIRMVQQFLPHLKAQPAAAILNITSGLAMVPFPLAPVYAAAKAGLRSYTQALRVQLQNTRVQVFELVPPSADTPLNTRFSNGHDLTKLIAPQDLVAGTLKGLENNIFTMYPGLAGMLRVMSRLAPGFLLKQLSKGVTEGFAQPQAEPVSAR